MASAVRNERERPVLLASFSSLLLVERPTRTEKVSVFICTQYSTEPRSCAGTRWLAIDSVDDRMMLMKDRILGLPRTVFFLGLTSFFNDFSSEMVASIFPAFFISVLKTGAESLGLVEGIADAASNLIKVYSGRWSDRIERRKVFAVAGYTLSVFTRPFYVLAGSVGAVIGLRL